MHEERGKKDIAKVRQTEDEIAEETIAIILEETDKLDAKQGGLNSGNMWKLKKKILPKSTNPPTAMIDKEGKLLTNKPDIDKQSMEYYKNVLRNRDIKPGLENYKI